MSEITVNDAERIRRSMGVSVYEFSVRLATPLPPTNTRQEKEHLPLDGAGNLHSLRQTPSRSARVAMLRVAYHFVGDLDLIEEYYCEPLGLVQERAYTLGAVCFTPEVVNVTILMLTVVCSRLRAGIVTMCMLSMSHNAD